MEQLLAELPVPLEQTRAILLFIIVFAVWIGVIGSLLYRQNRPARWYDSAIWVLTGGLITFVLFAPLPLLPDPRFLGRLIPLVWLVSLVGVVLNIFLLAQQKNGNKIWWAIASIGFLLLGLMICLPNVEQGRESARLAQCKINLMKMGLAMFEYYGANQQFPAQQSGNPLHSFRVDLLPFLDLRAVHDQYDMTSLWNGPPNLPVAKTAIEAFVCPANERLNPEGFGTTSYSIPVVDQGIYGPDQPPVKFNDIASRSSTLLFVEDCNSGLLWAEPRDVIVVDLDLSVTDASVKTAQRQEQDRPSLISSNHPQGANGLLANGSVKRFSPKTSPAVLKELLNASIAEPKSF